jgi:hypothetical protein
MNKFGKKKCVAFGNIRTVKYPFCCLVGRNVVCCGGYVVCTDVLEESALPLLNSLEQIPPKNGASVDQARNSHVLIG